MNIYIEEIKYKHTALYSDESSAPVLTVPSTTELTAVIESKGISIKIEISLRPEQIVMNGHTPDHEETIRKVIKNISKDMDA